MLLQYLCCELASQQLKKLLPKLDVAELAGVVWRMAAGGNVMEAMYQVKPTEMHCTAHLLGEQQPSQLTVGAPVHAWCKPCNTV